MRPGAVMATSHAPLLGVCTLEEGAVVLGFGGGLPGPDSPWGPLEPAANGPHPPATTPDEPER